MVEIYLLFFSVKYCRTKMDHFVRSTPRRSRMELKVQQTGQLFLDLASSLRSLEEQLKKDSKYKDSLEYRILYEELRMLEVIAALNYQCAQFEDDAFMKDKKLFIIRMRLELEVLNNSSIRMREEKEITTEYMKDLHLMYLNAMIDLNTEYKS